MEIILRAGKLKKKKFNLSKHTENIIHEVSSRYGISEDKLLLMALMEEGENKSRGSKVEKLRREIDELLSEMFTLEGTWASIRYRSHTFVKENRGLAIVLAGELGENKSLRNLLGKERAHDDIREVVDYYLWL